MEYFHFRNINVGARRPHQPFRLKKTTKKNGKNGEKNDAVCKKKFIFATTERLKYPDVRQGISCTHYIVLIINGKHKSKSIN